MTDTTKQAAEDYLREKYGAHRGNIHWRQLEEAYLAGAQHERELCLNLVKPIQAGDNADKHFGLCAPFEGMDIPWTEEKKAEFSAALAKYENDPDPVKFYSADSVRAMQLQAIRAALEAARGTLLDLDNSWSFLEAVEALDPNKILEGMTP